VIILKVYVEDRSFFLDEANLVRNIIELDYINFFSSLRYEQFATPLYLVIQKAIIQVLGTTSMVLRFISFLSVTGGLILFYQAIRHRFLFSIQSFVLLLIGYSPSLIRYGTEAKQYALDFLMACLSIWLIDRFHKKEDVSRIFLSVMGVLGVWLSMPFAFSLAGLGLFLIFKYREDKENLVKSLFVILSWLISFFVFYILCLHEGVSNSYLSDFHRPYFFGRNGNTFDQFVSLYRMILDKTFVPIIFGVLFTGAGLRYLYKNDKAKMIGTLAPVAFMLLASSFGYYSLIERLMIFTIPFLINILGAGLQGVISAYRNKTPIRRFVYFLMIFVSGIFLWRNSSIKYLFKPLKIEQGKEIMEWVYNSTEGPIYLTPNAVPFYEVYGKLLDNHFNFKRHVYVRLSDIDTGFDLSKSNNKEIEIVFVDVHTYGEEKLLYEAFSKELGIILKEKYLLNADARVIQIR
jgi:hypothetical protein